MGEPDRSDVDAQFAEIIAHWSDDDLARPGEAPWPEAEGEAAPQGEDEAPPRGEDEAAPEGGAGPEGQQADAEDQTTARGAGPGGTGSGGTGSGVTAGPPPALTPPSSPPGPPASPPVPPAVPAAGAGHVPPGSWSRSPEPVDEEPEEHFHPGPTEPLPAGDLQFWGIVVGLTAGPLLLLYLVLFDRGASSLWLLLSIAMTVGGFAMLVSRLPRHRNDDDDDDGARL